MGTVGLEYSSTLRQVIVIALLSVIGSIGVIADSAKDKEECAQQLTGLATCLPYVGGEAKAPTPDCCTGLKQLLKNNKKCLCVIIKDRNDPELSLQINVTLALNLPSVCNSPANVSKCPELLHLDPKSPESQVFYQLEKNTTQTAANSPAPSPSAGGPTSANSQEKSEGYCSDNKWSGSWVLVGGVLLWSFMGTLHLYI